MTWTEWALVAIAINWPGCWLFSWIYVGILLRAGDVTFESWLRWGWFPVGRFRQISRKSWFGRVWQSFYGHSMLGVIIHRDEPGSSDDMYVEKTIVHELRGHQRVQIVLGLLFYLYYGAASVWAKLRGGDWYQDNANEKYARRVADDWVKAGRPRVFNFGKRY